MSKRVHSKSNGGIEEVGSSRHKRRREGRTSPSNVDMMKLHPSESKERGGVVLSRAEVKDIGTQIWQTVRDAVKESVAPLNPLFCSLTRVIAQWQAAFCPLSSKTLKARLS
jgi:hypothetical protein